jgi:hypothetical protein
MDTNGCFAWKRTVTNVNRFDKKTKLTQYANDLSAGQACFSEGAHLIVTKYIQQDNAVDLCYHWMYVGDDWIAPNSDSCVVGTAKSGILEISQLGQFSIERLQSEIILRFKSVSVTYDTLENGISRSPISFERYYPVSKEDSGIVEIAEAELRRVGVYEQYTDTSFHYIMYSSDPMLRDVQYTKGEVRLVKTGECKINTEPCKN